MTCDEWIELLRVHQIELVVDVRELPQSRKRGFSKRGLESTLQEAGIEYVHVKELGNPKKWRQDLDAGLDFSLFAKRFEGLLDQKIEAIEELHLTIDGKRACLMCYEEDPLACHRSLVATRLASLYPEDVEVEHIRHG
jgi:uncharacterized protein (DUF488 family)